MINQVTQYVVGCEGASERAYLQELNRYLNEKSIPLQFFAKPSDGGKFQKVVKKYREVRRSNRGAVIWIWVDRDLYERSGRKDGDAYRKKANDIPDFLFSYMNFEDFLMMHMDTKSLQKWHSDCISRNHFVSPSRSREYMSSFCSLFFPSYKKGDFPIVIDAQSLDNLKKHQGDLSIQIKCDFASQFIALIDV